MPDHGKIDPMRLSAETRQGILLLAQMFDGEPGLVDAQITLNMRRGNDHPPTVHVICQNDPVTIGYWGLDQPKEKRT